MALDGRSQRSKDLFGDFRLPYKALPEINLADVSAEVRLLGKQLSQPLIIASMTGGTEHGERINRNLAVACEEMKIAFGVGSQRAALEKPEMKKTYKVVRKYAPKTVIFANMGAVQLNYGKTAEDYRRVVEMIEADALYLHLNPLQEAIQPEGDTNWKLLISKIENLIKKMPVPVWVKEVGHGVDPRTAKILIEIGVGGVDLAGVGGTSWAWIEAQRANNQNFADWLSDFGWPTDELLSEMMNVKSKTKSNIKIIASGGIRNPIQGLKAGALGADFYSAARPFLEPAMAGSDEVIKLLSDWEKGLKIAMFACGVKNWEEAKKIKF